MLLTGLLVALSGVAASADDGEYYYNNGQYYPIPEYKIQLDSPYLLDEVNRRSSLTPDPVWRSMFPSTPERITIEERHFGVGGQAAQELRYWQSFPK
jgi:hypothetical protein